MVLVAGIGIGATFSVAGRSAEIILPAVIIIVAGLTAASLRRRKVAHWAEQVLKKEAAPLSWPLDNLFLYTSLHNLTALMELDLPKARQTAENLAELVRCVTELDRRRRTFLGEELRAVDLYLAVEQARFGERLAVIKEYEPDCLEVSFPALCLLPLAVNCIRSGVELQSLPVKVTLSCRNKGGMLIVEIVDELVGYEAEPTPMTLREDAVKACRRRLDELFGEAATCERISLRPYGERIRISVPFREAFIPRFASDHITVTA